MTYLGDKQTSGIYKKSNRDNRVIYNTDEIDLIMDSYKTAAKLREENKI
jgi:hypothetical protein